MTLLPTDNDNLMDVLVAIANERQYQDKRWGTIEEHPHELLAWAKIIDLRLERVNEALRLDDHQEARTQLLKVAAVIVAALEQYGYVG